MKKLKSSARGKKRYLILSTSSKDEVEKIMLEALGTLGWAKAHPIFLEIKGKVVIAVDPMYVDGVRAALELSDKDIRIIRVSGTLKGLERNL
ncbi:hypothetical protein KW787_02570 [Candidatus Pacearchaeota archaeon]|nr:hypothetical protein [Candidatus Pacearchaeota archaeon]